MKKTIEDCGCLETVKEKIIERAMTSTTPGYQVLEGDWEYKSSFPRKRLYSNFIVKSTFTKKDGTTSKPKNEHASIFYTFCPFCGQKYPQVDFL